MALVLWFRTLFTGNGGRGGVLAAVLWLSLSGAAGATPVITARSADAVVPIGRVEFLVEQPALPLDARHAMGAADWQAFAGRRVNLGRRDSPVWVRFHLRQEAVASPRLLRIEWPLLDRVEFAQVDPLDGRVLAQGVQGVGLSAPAGDAVGFLFELAPAGESVVLLRIASVSPVMAPIELWQQAPLQSQLQSQNLLMDAVFGVILVMLLFNLSLAVFTSDVSYRYYSAYLATALLYELAVTGYGDVYFWMGNAWVETHAYHLFGGLSFLTAALFFRQFLDLPRCGIRHLAVMNNVLVGYWTLSTLAMPVLPPRAVVDLHGLMAIASILAAVYTSARLVVQGNVSARYFVIGWGVLTLGTAASILSLAGAIEGNRFTDNAQHLGFVIEIVLLSLALADRIRRERRSRHRAQVEALEATRRMEVAREDKIKAQEEAIRIQRRANEQLEQRVRDRTAELERANEALSTLSVTDALTQVHNRRYFDDVLARELERSVRNRAPVALLLVDIDHFKRINDGFGHVAGDECLRLMASALCAVARSNDLVARYGGEEFALVLPATGPQAALEVGERVRRAVADLRFVCRGQPVPMSVSVGVMAKVATASLRVAEFVAEADAALYRAKQGGRNRVEEAA